MPVVFAHFFVTRLNNHSIIHIPPHPITISLTFAHFKN